MSWTAIIAIVAVCAAAMVLDNRGKRKRLSPTPVSEESNKNGNGDNAPFAFTDECLDGNGNEASSQNEDSMNEGSLKNDGQEETADGAEGKATNEGTEDKATNEVKRNDPMARQVFIDTLVKIGCQYEFDSDGRILFGYQGERFVASANNEHAYVSVWDYCWQSVELQDIDEVARLRKCINEANLNCGVNTVFTIDNEGGTIDVHCHSIILFIPQIPDIAGYLRLELNEFFRAHQIVGKEMEKLREKERKVEG